MIQPRQRRARRQDGGFPQGLPPSASLPTRIQTFKLATCPQMCQLREKGEKNDLERKTAPVKKTKPSVVDRGVCGAGRCWLLCVRTGAGFRERSQRSQPGSPSCAFEKAQKPPREGPRGSGLDQPVPPHVYPLSLQPQLNTTSSQSPPRFPLGRVAHPILCSAPWVSNEFRMMVWDSLHRDRSPRC